MVLRMGALDGINMAVSRVSDSARWIGLAADTKPSSGVDAGDVFYETDTGSRYLYNGSSWVLMPSVPEEYE